MKLQNQNTSQHSISFSSQFNQDYPHELKKIGGADFGKKLKKGCRGISCWQPNGNSAKLS